MIQGISLRHLRFFLAVAQEASVRRAAEQLPTDASNLSRAIRELEHRLGNVLLFDRRQRPLQLTPAGLALARHGRDLEQHFQRVVGDLRSADMGPAACPSRRGDV
ncbi:LysR family transcriptional regulator [Pseudacidovorax sp. RU35E]|uniref:helix-turn-helix domain-containing protein n=1 Tax=Pseudacidovorax sp. RU35E TaxID=1907403 RepID=UPI000955B081|nr:LysR family transcriptional regulator [Pseudacidovorax sp. RU35E]SIR71132.1 regulatory helix-turn-helix protein, lysR family [Pseudacidovorax sp. RU35E]